MYENDVTTDFTKKLKILAKLHKILSAIDYIEKDARNDINKYNYASEKAIKINLHQAFKEFGVMMLVSLVNSEMKDTLTKDGSGKITIAHSICQFIDIESGESISFTMMGSGNGRDDKGLYAALTGIIKYALTSTFLIPTGDDAEADEERKPTFIKPEPKAPELPATPPPATPAPQKAPAKAKVSPDAPVAQKPAEPPATKPVDKTDIRSDFGNPQQGEVGISQADVNKILKVFAKHGVTRADLELKAGWPLEEFTTNMKANLNTDFQALKQGRCTKEQWVASQCPAVDYPPKGGAEANV